MIRNLALFVASVAVTGLLLEAVLRLFYPVPPLWLEPQIRHLKSPLLGWVLPPGEEAFTIDAPVRVNSHGLRDDEIPLEKPEGETRILALGDSFTFALGIRFEDLYAQQLERLLNERYAAPRRFQVINAGVAGYNTRQELIYLLADGFAYQPDFIAVGFYWNDLVDNEAELPDIESTPRVDPVAATLEDRAQHKIPRGLRDFLRQSLVFYLGVTRGKQLLTSLNPPQDTYSKVQQALLDGDSAFLEAYWEATGRRLRELAAAAQERGIPVVLFAFPMENQIKRDYPRFVFAERLRQIWEPTGWPFVDLGPAYRAALEAGVNPFLPYDLHPSPEGMRIAAEALAEVFESLDERQSPTP